MWPAPACCSVPRSMCWTCPRPGSKGDLDTRTFGGDPFWVGQLGQAFIRGVQTGSDGAVVTAAKHFPGQGGSDRRPEDEVATVQKSMQQLRQIELAPFGAVTAGGDPAGRRHNRRADDLSHPLSRLPGQHPPAHTSDQPGAAIAGPDGVAGVRRLAGGRRRAGQRCVGRARAAALLRPRSCTKFPHRQVAQDAFLAGNDLLYLNRFALTDDWPAQMAAITETIQFFQEKYRSDDAFRGRVDASVERILTLKQQVYGTDWQPDSLQRDVNALPGQTGQEVAVTQSVARAGLTLIYPGRDELADRMPSSPLVDENIVIFTDARSARECSNCPAAPLIEPDAIEEIILRLYGPSATGQVSPEQIRSFTFDDLARMLTAEPGSENDLEDAIAKARWIVFGQLDYNPEEYPGSAALRDFLAQRSDSLRDKRLVALSFDRAVLPGHHRDQQADGAFRRLRPYGAFPGGRGPGLVPGVHPDGRAAGLRQRHQLRPDPPVGARRRPDHQPGTVRRDHRQHQGGQSNPA